MKHLYILLLFSLIVAATATPWTYGVTSNPPIHWVSLVDDPLAVDVSSDLGDDSDVQLNVTFGFDFTFYGIPVDSSLWVLDSNGYISFNGTTSESFQATCPFPTDPGNFAARAFAFYWTDWDFDIGIASKALYRFFQPGSCPYPPKQSEGCLLVDYENATDNDGFVIGNVNAFVFTSGVMVGQAQILGPYFGEPSENDGAVFGIQDFSQNSSAMFPNSSCAWATGGFLSNGSFVGPSGQFSFAFYPPCGVIGNLTGPVRPDGLGCGCGGGYFPVNINCLPCAANQISDGITCSSCTGGLIPNADRSACIQPHSSSAQSSSGSGQMTVYLPLLFFLAFLVQFVVN